MQPFCQDQDISKWRRPQYNLPATNDDNDLPGTEPNHTYREVNRESFGNGKIQTNLKPFIPIDRVGHYIVLYWCSDLNVILLRLLKLMKIHL